MSGGCLRGKYRSTKTKRTEYYDSSYELRRFIALDASPLVKTWTKNHGLKIPYKTLGKKHKYIPDIVVEYHDGRKYLEEVKGFVYDKIMFGAKNIYAVSYCLTHGMKYRIIFKEQLEHVI